MRLLESLKHRWQTNVLVAHRYHGVSPGRQIPLPPIWMRQGGPHVADDRSFVESGVAEAHRLRDVCGLDSETRMLEIGCGAGRLPIGQLESGVIPHSYMGLEVQARHVAWCARQLGSRDARYRFVHVDARNERYNPGGSEGAAYPVADASVDLVYAYSVVSHMDSDEVRSHLSEIKRVMRQEGIASVTAFIEAGVEDEEINPADGARSWSGPLHCVRFSDEFFARLVEEAGLSIKGIGRGKATDGQSYVELVSS